MAEVVAGLGVLGAVIALGWLLVRLRALPVGADTVLTRVCFFAATPALLMTTVSRTDLRAVTSPATVASVASALGTIVGAGLVHRFLLGRSTAEAVIGALASGYVNAANLGVPVTVLLLGEATAIAPVLLLQLLVITPVAFAVLDTATSRGSPSRTGTLTVPLRNPLLWAVATGVAVNLADWDLRAAAGGYPARLLDMLGGVAVPLMMMALGASLAGAPRRLRLRRPRRREAAAAAEPAAGAVQPADTGVAAGAGGRTPAAAGDVVEPLPQPVPGAAGGAGPGAVGGSRSDAALWWAVGAKLVAMPALAVVLGLLAGLDGEELLVPVVTASLPSAQNVFMYASRYGVAMDLARDAVLLTTVGFVPVLLLAAALLG